MGLALVDTLIELERFDEVGLLIVDEVRMLGECGRGATLETLLTKSMFVNGNLLIQKLYRILTNFHYKFSAKLQVIGLSATIGNIEDIFKFLADNLYVENFRPVMLQEYVKCGSELLAVNPNLTSGSELFHLQQTYDVSSYSKLSETF